MSTLTISASHGVPVMGENATMGLMADGEMSHHDGVDTMISDHAPQDVSLPSSLPVRQSSRARKPSRRAEEVAAAVDPSTLPSSRRQASSEAQSNHKVAVNRARSASNVSKQSQTEKEVDLDGGNIEEEDDLDEESDTELYCLCRSKDDGRPMVLCGACDDWFHFKCVGLTKKAAASVTEFICPSCEKTIGRSSKGTADTTITSSTSKAQAQSPPSNIETTPDDVASPKRKREEDDTVNKRSKSSPAREASPHSQTHSGSLLPSSNVSSVQSIRKTSVPTQAPGLPPSSSSSSSAANVARVRSETLRKHAEKQFVGIFGEMMNEAALADADEVASRYAHDFEVALFESTSETAAPTAAKSSFRIAGKAYRDKLRSFLFNLKDKSNTSLRARIADGSLSARDLSGMTSEQLANDAIRQEVERRKRENLEQSILKKEKAPLRKLTHKGEIDIEYENAQVHRMGEDHDNLATSTRKEVDQNVSFSSMDEGREQLPVDTTQLPTSPNGKGKGERTSTDSPDKPVTPSQSSSSGVALKSVPRRTSQTAQSPTLPFDFSHVWQGDRHPDESEEDQEEDEPAEGNGPQEDNTERDPLASTEDEVQEADNFIDDFLGMQDSNVDLPDGQQDKNATSSPQRHTSESQSHDDAGPSIKWQGSINMPDEGAFSCAVRQIAGRTLSDEEWNNLLPTPSSLVEGRLPSGSAIPYLLQSRLAVRTELVAMTAEVRWVPNAMPEALSIKSAEANEQSFDRLLRYFFTKDRYGVLQPLRQARGRAVKDFYLAALPRDQPIPEWLTLLQPDGFSIDQTSKRERDLFLLVAVLFKQQTQTSSMTIPTAQSAGNTPVDLSRSPPIGGASPPASIATMLGPGSTTLQDLLRAVGSTPRNTAGATPPMPYGVAGNQSPANNGQGSLPVSQTLPLAIRSHDGIVPVSSMQALGAMPKPQLDDLLTRNPTLVEDLLKTLGRSGGAAPPPGPPPGPPPVRPTFGDTLPRPGLPPIRPTYGVQENANTHAYPTGQYGTAVPSYGQHVPYGGGGQSPPNQYYNSAQGYASPSEGPGQPLSGGYAPYQQPPTGPRRDLHGSGGRGFGYGNSSHRGGGRGRGRY